MSALQELSSAYADRSATAARWRSSEHPVIGYVGADVPVELLTAAATVPLRLAGDPTADRTLGDRYLGTGLDPVARSVLSGLLAGAYPIDCLVVSRDCEASLRLFYAVRELRRVEPALALPETWLVDILHLPHRTTTAYNTVRIAQLRDHLGDWTGRRVDDGVLAAAIEAHDEQRALLAELARLRHARPAAMSGTQFLAVVGAGTAMPVADHIKLLRALLGEAGATGLAGPGRRAFLTGSSHDTASVYRAIEEHDVTIVGEDHDWGELLFTRRTGPLSAGAAAGTLVEALAERYQYNGPSAARSTVRARAAHAAERSRECGAELLICYARRHDEAPSWDFSRQAEACELPTIVLQRQSYGEVDSQRLLEMTTVEGGA